MSAECLIEGAEDLRPATNPTPRATIAKIEIKRLNVFFISLKTFLINADFIKFTTQSLQYRQDFHLVSYQEPYRFLYESLYLP